MRVADESHLNFVKINENFSPTRPETAHFGNDICSTLIKANLQRLHRKHLFYIYELIAFHHSVGA